MRWEQITSEWNKDFLGCQDLSYQSGEVGFLLATGSFNNPFARGSVKTAYRTKTRSSGCIEFLFAPFFFILYLRPCQVQLSDIFRPMCVCIQGVSEAICLGRRSLMVWYYVLLPKHQKEIGQIGYLLGMPQGAFTANSPCKSPKLKPLIGHCLATFPRLISPLKIEPKSCNPTTEHTPWENHNSKRCVYPSAHSSTVYNSQDMEATWMSTDRWMDKDDVAQIYHGILLSHKKGTQSGHL